MRKIDVISICCPNELKSVFRKNSETASFVFNETELGLKICFEDENEFCRITAASIFESVKHYELLRLIGYFGFEKRKAEQILASIHSYDKRTDYLKQAEEAIMDCIGQNDIVVAEGVIRFRVSQLLDRWAYEIENAAVGLMTDEDVKVLLRLLEEVCVADNRACSHKGVDLMLCNDNSCVITDESGCRIECSYISTHTLLAMLATLSPIRLTVYDLTDNGMNELMHRMRALFGNRMQVFRKTGY